MFQRSISITESHPFRIQGQFQWQTRWQKATNMRHLMTNIRSIFGIFDIFILVDRINNLWLQNHWDSGPNVKKMRTWGSTWKIQRWEDPTSLIKIYKNIYLNVKRELITIWSSCADVNNSHNKVVVCYVDGLAAYFPGNGQFLVENIDPMLCTHIIYAFAGLDNVTHTIQSLDSFLDTEENGGFGK
jgi:hypothetical protein